MSKFSPRTVGTIEFSAAMALSGTIGFFVVESGQPAGTVVFFRCLFGALSLFVYCWSRGFLSEVALSSRALLLALAGGTAIVANWVLLFSSYQFASISVTTAVYHTQPFFLVLFSALLFRDRISAGKIAWIALAFIGLLLILRIDELSLEFSSNLLKGATLALGAAVLYALATLIAKQLKGIRPHILALVQVSLGTVLLLPFATGLFPFEAFKANLSSGQPWPYLVGLGLVHTCIMYILLYSGVQKLAVAPIAVLSFLYPIVAILVDFAVYHRTLDITQVAGIFLILLGSAGVNLNLRLPKFASPLALARRFTNREAEEPTNSRL